VTGRIRSIELLRVTRLFGSTCALRAVSASFAAGTITFLLGPNGAGKSTLLAIIGTLLQPTSGVVKYPPLGTASEAVRRQIGWVAHESRCYRELSGKQNIELAARLYGLDPAEAWKRCGGLVGIERFGERSVATLSRGQRQRIALARALVHSPSVLLLDEPWSGLDSASARRLEEVLKQERDRGTVIIVVTHVMDVVERLGGRRLWLERGGVVG
jgi:ABC-type multidrug transport system ATPase subunit